MTEDPWSSPTFTHRESNPWLLILAFIHFNNLILEHNLILFKVTLWLTLHHLLTWILCVFFFYLYTLILPASHQMHTVFKKGLLFSPDDKKVKYTPEPLLALQPISHLSWHHARVCLRWTAPGQSGPPGRPGMVSQRRVASLIPSRTPSGLWSPDPEDKSERKNGRGLQSRGALKHRHRQTFCWRLVISLWKYKLCGSKCLFFKDWSRLTQQEQGPDS